MTTDSGKDTELEYGVYLEERKSLIHLKFEESRLFDKAILTLAAGALGLSLAFIRQISPEPQSWSIPVLAIAWAGFCLSILSTLISFLTSQQACSRQLQILEARYVPEEGEASLKEANNKNTPATWTRWFNYLSIVFFVVGVVLLAVFSIFNLT